MDQRLIICGREIRTQGRFPCVARIEGDSYRFLEDPEAVISALRASEQSVDLFTFIPRLTDISPRYPYLIEQDNVAALPVTTFDQWWNQVLGFKARNKAKQAEKKGVELREVPFDDHLVDGIWKIYNECPIRQSRRFPHYGMTRDKVRAHAGTFLDCSVFLGAFFEGSLIGFAKLTIDESASQAGLMHILSLLSHRAKAPTNALIAEAVRSVAARNIPYLVYSSFSYGNKQRDSLSDFKERNGFQRVDVPRYYVPLNRFGKLAYRMGMHRRLIELLPEPVITKLRNYRANWYNARVPSALQGS
jgi:hypothetical protein